MDRSKLDYGSVVQLMIATDAIESIEKCRSGCKDASYRTIIAWAVNALRRADSEHLGNLRFGMGKALRGLAENVLHERGVSLWCVSSSADDADAMCRALLMRLSVRVVYPPTDPDVLPL